MSTETDGLVELEITKPVVEKKKRGRKKQTPDTIINNTETVIESVKPLPKKRGRKPKGGKIVQETAIDNTSQINEPNIILHLRCSLGDINENETYSMKYNPNIESIQSFNFDNSKMDNLLLEQLDEIQTTENVTTENVTTENVTIEKNNDDNVSSRNDISCLNKKDDRGVESISDKLNILKAKLHRNTISDKRSACFWCTHDFDSPPIFIPKHEFKNSYQVYGCFCSPECSVAHLMNEKIDSSVKFERYQLLNHIYGKIYNNEKNIKPAPDPHYLLEKFYGTLTIKEYRDLFKNDQLLLVVEKPLTHVFPELYEDNTDFILNQRTIPSNSTFKLRNRSVNKQTSVLESLNSKNK
jgi:hypothetical protein|tara:strand:+ start:5445 stop:6506 length:1062 start_codon:yes stop_codon:yes gene_type:complete